MNLYWTVGGDSIVSRVGRTQQRKINGGKYYWELQEWVNKLLINNPECLICGSKNNLEPHHVIQVKPYDKRYADVKNGVILCRECHNKYHEEYNNINPSTLVTFAIDNGANKKILKQNRKLKRKIKNLKKQLEEKEKLKEE